jgi:alkylhydroperoxidase family enzyme
MPRLRQVPRSDATPEVAQMYDLLFGKGRDPVADPGTATGTPGNWWTVFALVPDVFRHAVAGFGVYRSKNRRLDARLRELGQARAGFARGSQFVFSQHCKACRAAGIDEERIRAIPAWPASQVFDPIERAVLAYTDELVLQGGRVQDATFEALRRALSDEEILELTYIVCTYEMHATICRALRLEYDDVAERVSEIPGPHESLGRDIMRDISRPRDE